MVRYFCKECKYKFIPKTKKNKPRICPFCAREGTLFEEYTSQDILDKA